MNIACKRAVLIKSSLRQLMYKGNPLKLNYKHRQISVLLDLMSGIMKTHRLFNMKVNMMDNGFKLLLLVNIIEVNPERGMLLALLNQTNDTSHQ